MSALTSRNGRRALIAAGVVLLAAFPVLNGSIYYQNMLILTFVLAIVASGWNIMSGYTGYVSLGHCAFIGIGAYTAGIAAQHWGVSPFVVAPLGGVTAALAALLLGFVTRRTRGAAFVIVSFAMLELTGLVIRNWKSLTGGSSGLLMPVPTWDVSIQDWPFYYALLLLLVLSVALTAWIARSKLGIGLVAIRDDEDKAAGIGVTTGLHKSLAFMASAVLVGMAGAVYGYYISFLDPSAMFDIVLSVEAVLAAMLGGRGTVWGPILGAFILEPLAEVTDSQLGGVNAGAIRLIFFGGLLLAVVLVLPRGIIPQATEFLRRRRQRGKTSPVGARLLDSEIPATPVLRHVRPVAAGDVEPPLLELSGVTRRFGALTAVDDCTFQVPQGSISALIGPNGSGKTTVFNLVDGTYPVSAGQIRFAGQRIDGLGRTRRTFVGVARTYQLPRLFESLTVQQNVTAASGRFHLAGLARSAVSGTEAARARELLEFVGMGNYLDARAGALSYGQRKLVELAQVLMLDPQLILLDEPCAGINPTLIRRLASLIRALNEAGQTFLIVEHDMSFVLSLADPVVVLARGTVLATGTPDAISADAAVKEAYLGEDHVLTQAMTGGTT
ncbi:branched-chain amino acid ABC transporter ATP-binding protein/permease [Streptomyces mirabilis]|uniref:branched-chain amino acid ABC transporter ATP-binding protein/permease n=1 Tax=Streptomyces mirabilis TaxID=68239 RepID=UPI000765CA5C|nr:branched-chain amino acid ABC transporter ATP-binding protein/permease [Streptomyces mirabilis]MCX4428631.1 branched-chain amino acid ABC transporter ATP-binding protein/permease [Streptomyces mirabilis]